jgi:protein-tyrosine phosphatase
MTAREFLARLFRVPPRAWHWLRHRGRLRRARAESWARLRRGTPRKLLIVCYGNIYRSPFIAESLRARFAPGSPIEIRSGGFHPATGRPSPDEFIRLARGYGVELGRHRSTVVNRELLEWADRIVLMDRRNWDAVAAFGRAHTGKVLWLGAFTPHGPVEIPDPYGRPEAEVRAIAQRMAAAAEVLTSALNGECTNPVSSPGRP